MKEIYQNSHNMEYRRLLINAAREARNEGIPLLTMGLADNASDIRYAAIDHINRLRFNEEQVELQEQVVASVRDLLQRENNARILERSIDFLSRNKGLMALEGRLVELAADDNLAFRAWLCANLVVIIAIWQFRFLKNILHTNTVMCAEPSPTARDFCPLSLRMKWPTTLIADNHEEVLREGSLFHWRIKRFARFHRSHH